MFLVSSTVDEFVEVEQESITSKSNETIDDNFFIH